MVDDRANPLLATGLGSGTACHLHSGSLSSNAPPTYHWLRAGDLDSYRTTAHLVGGVAPLLHAPGNLHGPVGRAADADMGALPDGHRTAPGPNADTALVTQRKGAVPPDHEWSLREAMQTQHFWLLCGAYLFTRLGSFFVSLHQLAFAIDIGFDKYMPPAFWVWGVS